MLRVALILFAAALVAPSAATAQGLPITTVSPASGAAVAPATSVPFTVETANLDTREAYMIVEVATQPTLGQDGTLAEEYRLERVSLTRGDAFPNRFTGASYPGFPWPQTPGTYYWMAYCFCLSGGGKPVTSPVYTLTVTAPPTPPPPPLTMSVSEARSRVRPAIRSELGQSPHGLRSTCKARSAATVRCAVAWRTSARVKPSTYAYAGTLTVRALDNETYTYEFEGARAKASCVAKRRLSKCMRDVSWAETMELR